MLTFTEDGLTLAEETPSEAAISLSALGVASLGTNCSVGPASMVKVIEEMAHYTSVPLTAMPNAGFPTYVDGRFVYLSSPSYMAQHADQLLESGHAFRCFCTSYHSSMAVCGTFVAATISCAKVSWSWLYPRFI